MTYTLATDETAFTIDRATGQLMTKDELDKEMMASYTVMVTATDPYWVTDNDHGQGRRHHRQ